MPLTPEQTAQLQDAQKRVQTGRGTPIDKKNLAYATEKLGFGAQAEPSYSDTINQSYISPGQQKLIDLQSKLPGYLENESSRLQQEDPALQKLINERGQSVSQLHSSPFESREKYKDIFDPVAREALVSKSVGSILGRLSSTNDFISQRRGSADDRAQIALETLQSEIGIATTQAELEGNNQQQQLDLAFNAATLTGGVLSPETEKLLKLKGLLETWQGMSTSTREAGEYKEISDTEWADIEKNLRLNNKYDGSGGGDDGDKLLTPTEAERFGVPYGTPRSAVYGLTTGTTTKNYEDFIKEGRFNTEFQQIDPEIAYQAYQEAQQAIDAQPELFDQILNDSESQSFSHLLKPKNFSIEDQITENVMSELGI